MRTNAMLWVAIAGTAVSLAACAPQLPDANAQLIAGSIEKTPQMLPGVPNGFECPLVPNGLDPAGSIYRLDKNGTIA
jgi:hypothetical protein